MRLKNALLPTLIALSMPAVSAVDDNSLILDNGMKVIVHVDQRSPIVVQQLWYKIGTSYEHGGITGLSHMLEHMMFKATDQYPSGAFTDKVAQLGGSDNAFTSRDYTAYFQTVASKDLPVMMEMEAARMRGLKFNENEFLKELEVVKEERRSRTDDSPQGRLYEQFNAIAFMNSPSRMPVIGWAEDLASMALDDVKPWYDKWYRPNNAVLVIAGDVVPADVFDLAKQYYGEIESKPVPVPKARTEVLQTGERRISVYDDIDVPSLLMGYKVPSLATAKDQQEVYALEMLAGVLDGGNSARLSKNLVRDQRVANYAGAGYNLYDPRQTLFLMSASPLGENSLSDLEVALADQIKAIQEDGVSEAEIAKVRANVVSSTIFQQDSLFRKAMLIGQMETQGYDYHILEDYVSAMEAVTPEQVQRVAKKYFSPQKRTIAWLLPEETAAEETINKKVAP